METDDVDGSSNQANEKDNGEGAAEDIDGASEQPTEKEDVSFSFFGYCLSTIISDFPVRVGKLACCVEDLDLILYSTTLKGTFDDIFHTISRHHCYKTIPEQWIRLI